MDKLKYIEENKKALGLLIDSITKGVYVKSLRIDLCGTADDTSHSIVYSKYKKTGVLKVINSTYSPEYMLTDTEFYSISATKLVVKDTKKFDKYVFDFLDECQTAEIIPETICDGGLYIVKIKLSNGKKISFVAESDEFYVKTDAFYEFLNNYQNINIKPIPMPVEYNY